MKIKLTFLTAAFLVLVLLSALAAPVSHAVSIDAAEMISFTCAGFTIGTKSDLGTIDFKFELQRTNPVGSVVAVSGSFQQTVAKPNTQIGFFPWANYPVIPYLLAEGTLADGNYVIVNSPQDDPVGRTAGLVGFNTIPLHYSQSSILCERVPFCGDGILDPGEECDDGNNIDGDGCSANCTNEEPSACRVTAGGNKDGFTVPCALNSNGQPDPNSCADHGPDTWGGQAGSPPRIDGNWTHHHKPSNKMSFVFHSNNLFDITCSDPGDFCEPARFAPNRQIDFSGIGRFTNQKGYSFPAGDLCFTVHLEDTGEPGPGSKKNNVTEPCTHCPGTPIINATDCPNCTDYYMIRIYGNAECTGSPIYVNGPGVPGNCTNPGDPQIDGYFVDNGNVQLHPDNNGP